MVKDTRVQSSGTEITLPKYPALQRCLLIDARHGSRVELLKDLNASALFEEINQAKSLDDGMNMLRTVHFDACILGPSVTVPNAIRFLDRARDVASSSDCAYVVTLSRTDTPPTGEEDLLLDKAHGYIRRPCTKLSFTDWIIRAVVKANGASPWTAIFKQSGHENLTIPDPFAMENKALFEDSTPQKPTRPIELAVQSAITASFMLDSDSPLNKIVAGVEQGEFLLDPTGAPTRRSQEEIRHVISEVLGETIDIEIARFVVFYEQALSHWLKNLIHATPQEAETQLRATLLSYQIPPLPMDSK